jgi:hypothetical protein
MVDVMRVYVETSERDEDVHAPTDRSAAPVHPGRLLRDRLLRDRVILLIAGLIGLVHSPVFAGILTDLGFDGTMSMLTLLAPRCYEPTKCSFHFLHSSRTA